MDLRKSERVQSSDRMSGLCDELLHHIFLFLPAREVVQTCVLSKRWRNLWCSVPWLDFDEEAFLLASSPSSSSSSSSSSSFSTFVNYVMLLRDASNLQKLRLSCSSENTTSNRSFFQYIVAAALKHNLQLLDLKILHHHHQPNNVLPSSLFTCESLTSLKLNNVVLPSSSSSNICLSSLKTLHLISVIFPSNQLSAESLFSNSPNLETLTIQNCNFEHLEGFDVSVLKLKNLIIEEDVASSRGPYTTIYAPNLTSLKLHAETQSRWVILFNNSLVEANIHLKNTINIFSKYSSAGVMVEIFSELKNAKAITLSGKCLEAIGNGILSSVETSFHNLKLLKLTTWFEDGEVRAITYLLKQSPNIETLVIEYNSESSYKGMKLSQKEVELPSVCKLPHLKTIQMRGFAGRKNEVKLLASLLENAKSLEKMIVEKASI